MFADLAPVVLHPPGDSPGAKVPNGAIGKNSRFAITKPSGEERFWIGGPVKKNQPHESLETNLPYGQMQDRLWGCHGFVY